MNEYIAAYTQSLDDLFHLLLEAKRDGDTIKERIVLGKISKLADDYRGMAPVLQAINERDEVLQLGYRIDN